MKVKDYLPKLKANRYTYYNLDKGTIKDFQNSKEQKNFQDKQKILTQMKLGRFVK
jgi:hypothetical protein